MFARLPLRITGACRVVAHALRQRRLAATRPTTTPLLTGTLADLVRRKPALIAANALLRHQLVIL
jgi:hypothetical protein